MERTALLKARRCACGNLRRTTRAVTQFYDNCLKSSGLRSTQFSLLVGISLNETVSIGELAEMMLMDQTTVTRNLEGLIKADLVVVKAAEDDARKKMLNISESGMKKLSEMMPLWEAAQSRIEERLGDEKLREFLRLLSDVAVMAR